MESVLQVRQAADLESWLLVELGPLQGLPDCQSMVRSRREGRLLGLVTHLLE